MGTPATSSFIDQASYFHSDRSVSQVWSWVRSHKPPSLVEFGSSHGSTSEGISWSEPDRSFAVDLQLEVSVAADPAGTAIRVDGVGNWLDPRPIPDRPGGRRLRVTVRSGCPRQDGGAVGVINRADDLNQALLPDSDPTAALICQYGGVDPQSHRLVHQARLNQADARRIARRANRLLIAHEDDVITSCPNALGGVAVIAMHYPGRADVDLWAATSGCQTVSNGHIVVNGGLALGRWTVKAVRRSVGSGSAAR